MDKLRAAVSAAIGGPAHTAAFCTAFGFGSNSSARFYPHVGESLERCLNGSATGFDAAVCVLVWLSCNTANRPELATKLLEAVHARSGLFLKAWQSVRVPGRLALCREPRNRCDAPVPAAWCVHKRGQLLLFPHQSECGGEVTARDRTAMMAGAQSRNPLWGDRDAQWTYGRGVNAHALPGLRDERVRSARLALDVDGQYDDGGRTDVFWLWSEALTPQEVIVLRVLSRGVTFCSVMALPEQQSHLYKRDNRALRGALQRELIMDGPRVETMVGAQCAGQLHNFGRAYSTSDLALKVAFVETAASLYTEFLRHCPRSQGAPLVRVLSDPRRAAPSFVAATAAKILAWRQTLPVWARQHRQAPKPPAPVWLQPESNVTQAISAALRGMVAQSRFAVECDCDALVRALMECEAGTINT
jgi:hypothetical protein